MATPNGNEVWNSFLNNVSGGYVPSKTAFKNKVQPKAVVVPKSAPTIKKPQGLAQSASTLKAPPPMVSTAQPLSQTAVDAQPYANVTAGSVLPGVTPIGQTPQTALSQYVSTPESQQAYDTAAQQSANEFNVAQNEITPPVAPSNLFTDIGGAKGIADISGGLASLYSIYSGNQQNKRAQEVLDMQKAEYNRGVAKDKAFASNIAKSGLGSYSAGV